MIMRFTSVASQKIIIQERDQSEKYEGDFDDKIEFILAIIVPQNKKNW